MLLLSDLNKGQLATPHTFNTEHVCSRQMPGLSLYVSKLLATVHRTRGKFLFSFILLKLTYREGVKHTLDKRPNIFTSNHFVTVAKII